MAEESAPLAWRKAAGCGNTTCVEVAITADGVLVRDSEDLSGARLKFHSADWRAFIAGLRIETLTPPR
ncbi:DUF397 domain-containing protein [Dactylosporangium darangshiense]|uniref:DUF397 domain-containing protein n=1 Tax=Dactylosporangium darangshiense TaxID=579108 RepID=A0ABP8DJ46_9ACTN